MFGHCLSSQPAHSCNESQNFWRENIQRKQLRSTHLKLNQSNICFELWHQWFGCESYPKSCCVFHAQGKPSELRHEQAQQGIVPVGNWGYGCATLLGATWKNVVLWCFHYYLGACCFAAQEACVNKLTCWTSRKHRLSRECSNIQFPFTNH